MKLTDVIRRPLVTEKTTTIREGNRTVVFEVAIGATKVDIKRAVEKLLGSKIFLELWVKVKKDWRNREAVLKSLGFRHE